VKGVPALGGNIAQQRTALIAYPFPLRHGQLARLELPNSGLDPLDADRLIEFIRALTIPERMDRP